MKKRKKFLCYLLSIGFIFSFSSFSGCKRYCNHDWNNGEVQNTASCTSAGKVKYTCKKCGEYEIIITAPIEHILGQTEIVKEPTKTEEGLQFIYCKICGKVAKKVAIPKIK